MKTEQAIEFLNKISYKMLSYEHKEKDDGDMVKINKYLDDYKEVIKLLQCGEENEKYKAMFWDMVNYFASPDDEVVIKIKQKYFPKPKPELVELARKIDKEVRELLNKLGG